MALVATLRPVYPHSLSLSRTGGNPASLGCLHTRNMLPLLHYTVGGSRRSYYTHSSSAHHVVLLAAASRRQHVAGVCRRRSSNLAWGDVLSAGNRARWLQERDRDAPKIVTNRQGSYYKSSKASSVLLPLCHVSNELCFLYTVRSSQLRNHKGEVSFPGGKMDPIDEGDPVKTALREMHEEIGVPPSDVDVWGVVPPQFDITGVLGYIGSVCLTELRLNPYEVSSVFAVPLMRLCDSRNFRHTQFRSLGGYSLPVFVVGCGAPNIWGFTAIITHFTLQSLLPGLYSNTIEYVTPI